MWSVNYRNFPLTEIHPYALHAAEAAEAADAQGRFWPMHDELFAHQHALEEAQLRDHARAVGLDTEWFAHDMAAHAHLDRIRADVAGGRESGVQGTPTFFVNGVRHDRPWDAEGLGAAIEDAGCRVDSSDRDRGRRGRGASWTSRSGPGAR